MIQDALSTLPKGQQACGAVTAQSSHVIQAVGCHLRPLSPSSTFFASREIDSKRHLGKCSAFMTFFQYVEWQHSHQCDTPTSNLSCVPMHSALKFTSLLHSPLHSLIMVPTFIF